MTGKTISHTDAKKIMKNEKRQMTKEIDIYSFFIVFLRLDAFTRDINE